MTLPNLLERLTPGAVVLTPGDRADVVLGVLMARLSGVPHSQVSGLILTGGLRPPQSVLELMEQVPELPPVAVTERDTYETRASRAG